MVGQGVITMLDAQAQLSSQPVINSPGGAPERPARLFATVVRWLVVLCVLALGIAIGILFNPTKNPLVYQLAIGILGVFAFVLGFFLVGMMFAAQSDESDEVLQRQRIETADLSELLLQYEQ